MSAEASGPAAAEALSLEVSKPSGLEPGSAAYGLRPLTPNSKYVKLNVGGSLHYTTLRTLTGQDTMLKAMFSGRAEVLTDAGGTRAALTWAVLHPLDCRLPDPSILPPSPSVFIPLLWSHCHPVSSFSPSPASTSHLISPFSFIISLVSQSLLPAITNTYGTAPSPTLPGAVAIRHCHLRGFITASTQVSHPSLLSSKNLGTSLAASSTLPGSLPQFLPTSQPFVPLHPSLESWRVLPVSEFPLTL